MAPFAQFLTPSKKECPITVTVRIRPPLDIFPHRCVQKIPDRHQVCVNFDASVDGTAGISTPPRLFTFDHVFDTSESQSSIYNICAEPIIESVLQGYNATVLAYGQTGSGKTYTMGTCPVDGMDDKLIGLAPRLVNELVNNLPDANQRLIRVSYIELYQEEVRDLLHNPELNTRSDVNIREDRQGNIVMQGVSQIVCQTQQDVLALLERGSQLRTTGETNMNHASSRSHAIFSILVEQYVLNKSTHLVECRVSKLHLVDLAGSERQKRTGADGLRFKESIKINEGLLALGNVINALAGSGSRNGDLAVGHVPYRDSKLTRLLQDSLGGNSKTVLIACVSPLPGNAQESLNTLMYANRAKNIKNRPNVNIIDPPSVSMVPPCSDPLSSSACDDLNCPKVPQNPNFSCDQVPCIPIHRESSLELLSMVEQLKTGLTEANTMILDLQSTVRTKVSPIEITRENGRENGGELMDVLHKIADCLRTPAQKDQLIASLLDNNGAATKSSEKHSFTATPLPPIYPTDGPIHGKILDSSLEDVINPLSSPPPMRMLGMTSNKHTRRCASISEGHGLYADRNLEYKTPKLESKIEQLERELAEKTLALQQSMSELTSTQELLEKKNNATHLVEQRANDAEEKAFSLQEKVSTLQANYAQVSESSHERELEHEQEIEAYQDEIHELRDQVLMLQNSQAVQAKDTTNVLQDELVRLTQEMETKLVQIQELNDSRQKTDQLSQKFDTKMTQLEKDLADAEKHIQKLKCDKIGMNSEKAQLKQGYEKNKQDILAQLTALKKRQSQHDRLLKDKLAKEKQIQELQIELNQMRDRHGQLEKKIKNESLKLSSVQSSHHQIVTKLERQKTEDDRKIKILTGQVLSLRQQLDAKKDVSPLPKRLDSAVSVDMSQAQMLEQQCKQLMQERDALQLQVQDLDHYKNINRVLRQRLQEVKARPGSPSLVE